MIIDNLSQSDQEVTINEMNMPSNPPNGELLQSQNSEGETRPKKTSEDPSPNKRIRLEMNPNRQGQGERLNVKKS